MTPLLPLLLACSCQPEPAPAQAAPEPPLSDGGVVIHSPGPDRTLEVPWIPLAATLPVDLAGSTVTATLDGVPLEDPDAILRRRWSDKGEGVDWLSELDLSALSPGGHTLALHVTAPTGDRFRAERRFRVDPWPCPVTLTVRDPDGAPLGARVLVRSPAGPLPLGGPDAGAVDPMDRDAQLSSLFLPTGSTTVRLPRTELTLVATRGPRWGIDLVRLPLDEACEAGTEVALTLEQTVPTPGWRSADLHVHTGVSGDSFVPDGARFRSLAAADLDAVVITDHRKIRETGGAAGRHAPGVQVVEGTEARFKAGKARSGHANVFPLSRQGARFGKQHDLREHIDGWRARARAHPLPDGGSAVLVQLNHPRGLQTHFRAQDRKPKWGGYGLFGKSRLQRHTPLDETPNAWLLRGREDSGTTWLDFDLLEVLNRFSWEHYRQVRADWFLLMNAGIFPTGTGNSDSHALAVELAGVPMNLVAVADDSVAALIAGLQAGRVTVTSGPVLDLRLRGEGGEEAGVGGRITGGAPTAVVTVRAAPWVPVDEVRLVQDGALVFRQDLPHPLPPEGVTVEVPLSLARDGWVLAEAGQPPDAPRPPADELGLYAWIAPGYVPLAFTNPVRVDADGDGALTPMSYAEAAAVAARGLPMPRTVGAAPGADDPSP